MFLGVLDVGIEWLKIEHDTPDKPEVLYIASRLGISIADAFLACFKLWRWADRQTLTGVAVGVTTASLDAHIGVTGFAQSCHECGWLLIHKDGLEIPRFDEHVSQSAKRRASTAKRMCRLR
jgi:hypothetical protein